MLYSSYTGGPRQSVPRWFLALAFVLPSSPTVAQGIPEPPIVLYGIVTDALGKRLTEGQINVTVTPASGGTPITVSTNLADINLQFSYVLSVPCETVPSGFTGDAGVLALQASASARATIAARLGAVSLQPYTPAEQSIPISIRDRGHLFPVNLSTVAYVDTDEDGLLDSWERRYFGGLSAKPSEDPDNDGASNLAEQRAGTNPVVGGDPLEFVEVAMLPDFRFQVTWSTKPNLRYRLLQSTEVWPPSTYQPITEAIAGDGNPITRVHAAGAEVGASFYRVEVVP